MHGWGFGGEWMFFGGFLMLLFWGVVIALAVWAIRALTRSDRDRDGARTVPSRKDSALEILKQRYSRGEISREEYQGMRRDLEG